MRTATAPRISGTGVSFVPLRLFSTLAASALLTSVLACGSNTGSAPTKPSPPAASTITSVSVACNPATIDVSTTSQCTATVSGAGSYSSSVTWSASTGTIDSNGLFTAPSAATTATVTAASTQDTSQSGKATVTVQGKSTSSAPRSNHVVLVMEENQSYSTVVGSSAWPHLNHLIATGALPTNYYGDTHPSIGNYFMLTTGQILTNDDSSTTVFSADNIARRMLSSNVAFRIYAEGITRGYLGGNTGLYLIRHNPFAMLSDVADSSTVANDVLWPFSQLTLDLSTNALPAFTYIVPDVNDDAHNGTPQEADAWLLTNVITPLSADPAFQPGGDGVLIVDFDEAATSDTTHGGGHVAPVLWGPGVKAGYRQTSSALYQHESMLATIMELLSLPNPPGNAANAPLMNEFFVQQ
ncbi:MAG TPA: alkaline phosphatase family protein [Acidobacteriaceae bacterium]|jgi:acid phosphatase|nr:alkaline phosphatase family protein [Acidobacteriaceae bacterium]